MRSKWWAGRNSLALAALAVVAVVVLASFQVSRWRAGPPPAPAEPLVSEKAALPAPHSTGRTQSPAESPPPPARGATAAEAAHDAAPAPSSGEVEGPPAAASSPAMAGEQSPPAVSSRSDDKERLQGDADPIGSTTPPLAVVRREAPGVARSTGAGTVVGQAVAAGSEEVAEAPASAERSRASGRSPGTGGIDPGRSQAPRPRVRLVPERRDLQVGERLVLRIEMVGGNDVGSVPFHLRFNPAVLEFLGGFEGSFLGSDGRATAFFAAPTSRGDEVVVGLSRLGAGEGIAGGGVLCELEFQVVGSGDAGLAFSREKVRDAHNRIVASAFDAGQVLVP